MHSSEESNTNNNNNNNNRIIKKNNSNMNSKENKNSNSVENSVSRNSSSFYKNSLPVINVLSMEIQYNKPTTLGKIVEVESAKDPNEDSDETDIISEMIGHYGLWQFIWTFLLSLFLVPNTLHIFSFVFQTIPKDFWCARPSNFSTVDVDLWRNITQPNGSCTILNYDNFSSLLQSIQENRDGEDENLKFRKCEKFEFSHAETGRTLVEEFNLVCDKAYFLSVVEMCFLAGAAVGSISSGWLSDKFGRRNTLMIFATIQTCLGTGLAFSNSLWMYMTLRVIVGFASMTVGVVSFVLVVELVSGKWRTIIGILNILPVAISYIITSGIAYLVRDWRSMQLCIATPWFSLLFIWFYLPESPRWLLAQGKVDRLIPIIESAAKMNKRKLPMNYEKTLYYSSEKERLTNSSDDPFTIVFNKQFRITTFLTLLIWFSLIIQYFGLTLHLSNLGGNIYINTAVSGAIEALSICLSVLIVLKLGVKFNSIGLMLISGVSCLLVNVVPSDNNWMVITLAMIAKCAIGANNAVIPIFTAQQYPTVVRNVGVGVGNFAAGIALILVPYLWLLEHIQIYLPMTVMGCTGIIGAIALVFAKNRVVS